MAVKWPTDKRDYERILRRERTRAGAAGFVLAIVAGVLAFLVLLAMPAKAQYTVKAEAPAIHQAEDGTYTNDLEKYPEAKPVELERGYAIRAEVQPGIHHWSAPAEPGNLHGRGEDTRSSEDAGGCVDVWGGTSSKLGGGTVCGVASEGPIVVDEQRVRRRGSIVTSTDTVVTQGGRELLRLRGRRAEHDPGRTVVE